MSFILFMTVFTLFTYGVHKWTLTKLTGQSVPFSTKTYCRRPR